MTFLNFEIFKTLKSNNALLDKDILLLDFIFESNINAIGKPVAEIIETIK